LFVKRPLPRARGGEVVAVVLSWNDGDRVIALLDRLAALDPPPDHVVTIDNGSTDGSALRIAHAFPQHEHLRLDTNRGFAAAANCGIERAIVREATWVWLLNSDIVLPVGALAALRAAAEADERCALAAATLLEPDGSIQARGGGRVNLWTGSCTHVVSPGETCDYLSAACLLLRVAALREIGLFDEDYFFYWEDVDLSFRARAAGWTLAVAEDCRVVHLEGSSLGRWSELRWYHLFRGLDRFLHRRAALPRTAVVIRLLVHSATMLRHRRLAAVRGAWRAFAAVPARSPSRLRPERSWR